MSTTTARRAPVLQLALVAAWIAFALSVALRPQRGEYVAWLDAGLYNVPFSLAALACWLRGSSGRRADAPWRYLSAALVLFVCGNLWGSLVVGDSDVYPSLADVLWLGFYPLAYLGIIGLARARMTSFHPSRWLDGAVGGFGIAALVVGVALGPSLSITQGRLGVVATNLAFPAADVVLLVVLVTSGVALRGRQVALWLLGLGMAVFCLADVLYLFEDASGSYQEGGVLDLLWPFAAVLMGSAALLHHPGADQELDDPARLRFVVPVFFTATSVALLVYGQQREVPLAAVVLAVTALATAGVRVALTFKEVQALAESRREARTDELTGLPNRRAFLERLDEALGGDDPDPFVLLVIDLDGFKEVNDSLGHSLGDDLLAHVAHRFQECLPAPAMLARLGGDEFGALVADGAGEHESARLIATLEAPFAIDGVAVRVGASIGLSRFPDHGASRTELLRTADVAMYTAKRGRMGCALYDPSTDPHSRDQLGLLEELRSAIDARALQLHFQPIVDLGTMRAVGVEALVRWPHPTRGLVLPDSFIPVAEQSGLITRLTRAVLDQAVAELAALRGEGWDLGINVNISGLDLVDESLPAYVAAALVSNLLAPKHLTLEITESMLAADPSRADRIVGELRSAGVRVSIDDFGVGYSSMSQLLDLPFDELKVDRSFVSAGSGSHKARAILSAAVELGRALGVDVVAEGVEAAEALALVHELGADRAQGYLIARPLDAAGLRRFLSDSGTRLDRPALGAVSSP